MGELFRSQGAEKSHGGQRGTRLRRTEEYEKVYLKKVCKVRWREVIEGFKC